MKRGKIQGLLTYAVIALLFTLGAGAQESGASLGTHLAEDRVYKLKVGETVMFIEGEIPSTGYIWSYEIPDDGILEFVSTEYRKNDPENKMPGGDGRTMYLTVKALTRGETVIEMLKQRGPDEIAETRTYRIVVTADNGLGLVVPLFSAYGDEALAWRQRALDNDPPWMLTVSAQEETQLWIAEVYEVDRIRSYLHALGEIEVYTAPRDEIVLGAMTMTYTFHMRDGSRNSFTVQDGWVCAFRQYGPDDVEYAIAGTGGTENLNADLQSLDRFTLAQLRVVEEANTAEQERQIVTLEGDTLSLILEENPTTGFLWTYFIEPDVNLTCVADEYKPDAASLRTAGGGGKRHLTFRADGSGFPLIQLRRTGPDGSSDHITGFQLYVEDGTITAVERVRHVLD